MEKDGKEVPRCSNKTSKVNGSILNQPRARNQLKITMLSFLTFSIIKPSIRLRHKPHSKAKERSNLITTTKC